MADVINIPTYEQIETLLERLVTDYSTLASIVYDVFYNPEPKDVTFEIMDKEGVVQEVTIPNRAKDMEYKLTGNGTPEGNVGASIGTIYQDLDNGNLYIKETAGGSQGWSEFATISYLGNIFIQGTGNPEGSVQAAKGVLYIDTASASLYIKSQETGADGWMLISVPTGSFAYSDLSNITEDAGLDKFASRALDNLSVAGNALINSKENVSNKVTALSTISSDIQYPSAKCVYDAINNAISVARVGLESTSNKVDTVTSSSTNVQYPTAKCVYDSIQGLKTLTAIQDKTVLSSGDIILTKDVSAYSKNINGVTTFNFISNNIADLNSKVYTFELIITMPTPYSIIWPSNLIWQEGNNPDLADSGVYFFAFRTLDGGSNWYGNLQGTWELPS